MIALFGDQRRAGHEAERLNEVLKDQLALKARIGHCPLRQLAYQGLDLILIQSLCCHRRISGNAHPGLVCLRGHADGQQVSPPRFPPLHRSPKLRRRGGIEWLR